MVDASKEMIPINKQNDHVQKQVSFSFIKESTQMGGGGGLTK